MLIISGTEMFKKYPNPRTPIIHDVMRECDIMNIISRSKSGKTMMAIDLATAVATGGDWLGFKTEKKKVLFISGDLSLENLAQKMRSVQKAKEIDESEIGNQLDVLCKFRQPSDLDELNSDIFLQAKFQYGLTIIDEFSSIIPLSADLSSSIDMAVVYDRIWCHAMSRRTSIVMTHTAFKQGTSDSGGVEMASRVADVAVEFKKYESGNARVGISTRSFPPIKEFSAKFKYPLWLRDKGIDVKDDE